MTWDYGKIPPRTLESLRAWIESGRPLGDFCRAVISNDLRTAIARADENNLEALPALIRWLVYEAPAHSWGYSQALEIWPEKLKQHEKI